MFMNTNTQARSISPPLLSRPDRQNLAGLLASLATVGAGVVGGLAVAGLVYALAGRLGGEASLRFFAAVIGTSSWLYVGLAFLSPTWKQVVVNLLAGTGIFAVALSAAASSPVLIATGFLLHGAWGAAQLLLWRKAVVVTPQEALPWMAFNTGLAALILVLGG